MFNGFERREIAELIWKKPYFVQIELTRNCNFKCIFCFENCSKETKYNDKNYEDWKKVIDELKILGVKQVHFSGGENFLYKDFSRVVKYASDNDFDILINTNGFFDISEVVSYAGQFVFSLHGYKEINEIITNMPKSFEKVEKNIGIALMNQKSVIINSVLVEENFKGYIKLFKYLESKYIGLKYSPTLAIKCKTGNKLYKPIELSKENLGLYQEILDLIGEEKLVYKHGLFGLRSNTYKNDFEMPVCAAGKSKLIIKYNGNVYPCNFFQTQEYLCGNVFSQNLKEIWENGKGFNTFRQYFLDNKLPDRCVSCKKVNNCFSGCRAWTKSYLDGDIKIKSEGDVRCELINAYTRTRDNNEM